MNDPSIAAGFDKALGSDHSLELVKRSGDRLMSMSGLSYSGRVLQIDEQPDVHVMEFGSGHPLLLIHGGGGGGAVWHRQIAALAENYRVIVPDLPMFGLSAIPTRVNSIREDVSRLILGIMDVMGLETAHIVGHSLGGLSAIGALKRQPQRFDKVALVSSAGFGREIPWVYRATAIPIVGEIIAIPNRNLLARFFAKYEAQFATPSEEVEEHLNYHFLVMSRRGRYRRLLSGLRIFSGVGGQLDVLSESELKGIENPTLVVWGSDDRFFPVSHYERAVAEIPEAEGVRIPDCGHLPGVDAPERYTEILADWFTQS